MRVGGLTVMGNLVYDPKYTSLLLHMNGADSGVVFPDSCFRPKTIFVSGAAQTKTGQKKFGSASAYFNGSTAYLGAESSDLDMGTGDFTVDFWLQAESQVVTCPGIIMSGASSWSSGACGLAVDHAWSADKVLFTCYDYSVGGPLLASTTTILTDGTWYHVAAVRSGNTFKLYINGVPESTQTFTGTINFDFNLGLRIGGGNLDGANGYYKGYLDELRFSKGIARWTADFSGSLPAAEYLAD